MGPGHYLPLAGTRTSREVAALGEDGDLHCALKVLVPCIRDPNQCLSAWTAGTVVSAVHQTHSACIYAHASGPVLAPAGFRPTGARLGPPYSVGGVESYGHSTYHDLDQH